MTREPRRLGDSRSARRLIFAVLGLGLVALVTWGLIGGRGEPLSGAKKVQPADAPALASGTSSEPVVTVDAAAQRQSGLETIALQAAPYQEQLRAYGKVIDLRPLTDASSSYANAKAQLDAAQAKFAVSQTAFRRAQTLYKDRQNISAAQLDAAEGAFRADEAALAMAQSQLRTVTATAQQAWGPVLTQALVDDSPMLEGLIGRKDVLLQVTLPLGEDIADPPPTALVRPDSGSGIAIRLVSPATMTDPRLQGVSFLYIAPAASALLPGMNVLVFLPSGPNIDGLILPQSAVVWWHGRAWVYLHTAPESFTRREIATDQLTGTGFFQAKGFAAGDEVVIQGAQLLLSEEFSPRPQTGAKGTTGDSDDD